MAARHCLLCQTRWPTEARFQSCPRCNGERTVYVTTEIPDADWEQKLERSKPIPVYDAELKVERNRFDRLRASGLDIDRALIYAGDRDVDVHLFEDLVEGGCPIDTAARIIAPLS